MWIFCNENLDIPERRKTCDNSNNVRNQIFYQHFYFAKKTCKSRLITH